MTGFLPERFVSNSDKSREQRHPINLREPTEFPFLSAVFTNRPQSKLFTLMKAFLYYNLFQPLGMELGIIV